MEHWSFLHDGIIYPGYFKVEIDGIVCYADQNAVERLEGVATVTGKLVEGEKPPYYYLSVQFPSKHLFTDAYIWPIERTDALKIAKKVSTLGENGAAFVWAHSRSLAVCRKGEVVARRTLSDFYDKVAQSDLDATALD